MQFLCFSRLIPVTQLSKAERRGTCVLRSELTLSPWASQTHPVYWVRQRLILWGVRKENREQVPGHLSGFWTLVCVRSADVICFMTQTRCPLNVKYVQEQDYSDWMGKPSSVLSAPCYFLSSAIRSNCTHITLHTLYVCRINLQK